MLFVPLITLGKEEECNLDGLCVSFLLEVTVVLSKTECYLKCHENPDCLWYTHNYYHDQTCHLNKGCNFVALLNQGFVQSQKNCYPESTTQSSTESTIQSTTTESTTESTAKSTTESLDVSSTEASTPSPSPSK